MQGAPAPARARPRPLAPARPTTHPQHTQPNVTPKVTHARIRVECYRFDAPNAEGAIYAQKSAFYCLPGGGLPKTAYTYHLPHPGRTLPYILVLARNTYALATLTPGAAPADTLPALRNFIFLRLDILGTLPEPGCLN